MNVTFKYEIGIPSHEFFSEAWASEPLTGALKEVDIVFALPAPDEDASLVCKDENGRVIGQCSANRVKKYWNHIDEAQDNEKNRATQIFLQINRLAVELEKKHFSQIKFEHNAAFHSAGIAVLPELRGKGVGNKMRKEQIELCKKLGAKVIYCETTNKYSAATVLAEKFVPIKELTYNELAKTLEAHELANLNDSYIVWALEI